jgi:hypothetical protein
MGLVRRAQRIPRLDLQVLCPVMYPIAGVYASHEKSSKAGQWHGRPGPWEASFILGYYAGHACEQARQLLINASKRALHCLTVTAGYPVRHTPVIRELPPPKHNVTEGFMALVKT